MLFSVKVLVSLLAAGMMISDLRNRSIPNFIPLALIAVACANALHTGEWPGVVASAIIFCIGLVLFRLNLMGGGDVKVLTAAAFLLPGKIIPLCFVTSLAGGLVSIACMLYAKLTSKICDDVPYGVAIGAGILHAVWV